MAFASAHQLHEEAWLHQWQEAPDHAYCQHAFEIIHLPIARTHCRSWWLPSAAVALGGLYLRWANWNGEETSCRGVSSVLCKSGTWLRQSEHSGMGNECIELLMWVLLVIRTLNGIGLHVRYKNKSQSKERKILLVVDCLGWSLERGVMIHRTSFYTKKQGELPFRETWRAAFTSGKRGAVNFLRV